MHGLNIFGTFLVLLRVSDVMAQTFRTEEGPYKTVISNVSRCGSAPAWFQWNMTAYTSRGHSLLRGTITPTRNIKDSKFRVLMYYLEEKKTKVFDMKNQNCHNTIVDVILKTIAIPFNEQSCLVKAGSYTFKEVNVDTVIHTVVGSLWYGAAELRLQVNSQGASLMCLDIHFQITKLK